MCGKKSIFSDPQKRINSGGKIYLGNKIKMPLKCCSSVHPAMDNEGQKEINVQKSFAMLKFGPVHHPASSAEVPSSNLLLC